MKILFDCRSVYPGRGGIGRHAEALAHRLPAIDQQNDYLLCVPTQGEILFERLQHGQCLNVEAAMIDPVWEQVQLPQILKKQNVDLYHNPCFSIPAIPTVTARIATVHDAVFRTHPEWVAPKLAQYLDRWTEHSLLQADAVITVSEYSRREIASAYHVNPDRLHVVGNGIDHRFIKLVSTSEVKAVKEKWLLPDDCILYVGSVEKKKNIDRLLDAIQLLVQNNEWKQKKLILAGGKGGQDYDLSAAISCRQLESHVMALGHVPDVDVAPLMRAATIVVYPSLYEGFGMPPLEAMACQTPVIVSDATSLPEVTGDAALIFPAEDTTKLADAIATMFCDPSLRASYVQKGLCRMKDFTWESVAEKTLNVYRKVMKETA